MGRRERQPAQHGFGVARLDPGALEELATGRGGEKQILDHRPRAGLAGAGNAFADNTAFNAQLPGFRGTR
jgi:hypothetical protein